MTEQEKTEEPRRFPLVFRIGEAVIISVVVVFLTAWRTQALMEVEISAINSKLTVLAIKMDNFDEWSRDHVSSVHPVTTVTHQKDIERLETRIVDLGKRMDDGFSRVEKSLDKIK